MYSHVIRNAEMSDFSCLLMHYAIMKYLMFHVLSCITQYWNILCLMYSHALRNAEQSNVSNIILLYAMLRYMISHVLRYAEISDVSCITQCWNVGFLIFYVILIVFLGLACITFCRNIRFLIITLYIDFPSVARGLRFFSTQESKN